MNKRFKYIIVLCFTAFTLFVSVGINVNKMQCEKGARIFVGIESPDCKTEKQIICPKQITKEKCCKKKQETEKKPKGDCKKRSTLLQFDFITQECKCSEVLDFSVSQPFLTILYDYYQNFESDIYYTLHYADAPPLVKKPILSQLQSFLL
ncbi:MAG: hypothetical protein H8E84_05750 [Flavobacteriales bacterium]|nr:hypothetical protein [Flavobacteriales bacterium]